jgi:hypothetical protein
MIDRFYEQLAAISPVLPILIKILIAWLVLALPAYWLCRTLGVAIFEWQMKLTELRRSLGAKAAEAFKACTTPIEKFVIVHAQMFSFAHENQQILDELLKLRKSVDSVPVRVQSLESTILEARKRFDASVERLSQLELPRPIEPPGSQDFSSVQKGRNRAVVTLILALIFTPGFVIFNTGMLSEFLESFSPGLEYFGLPLSTVLAGFATLIEIALGALLVLFPARPAQMIWYGGIVVLAFVELSFYARLGEGFNWSVFDAFYPRHDAPAWTKEWFGLFGPVLVACLAGSGHAFFSSVSQLADHHVVRQWRWYIKRRMRTAKELREKLGDVEHARQTLGTSLERIQSMFATAQDVPEATASVIEHAKQGLLENINLAAIVRLNDTRRLDRGAMLRQLIECLVFAAIIAIAFGVLAFVYSLSRVTATSIWFANWWLGATVAIGEGVMLLLGGSAYSRSNTVLPAAEGAPATNLPQNRIGPIIGLIILTSALIGNIFFALHNFNLLNLLLLALLILSVAGLFWCGTRLGLIGAALWSVLLAAGYILVGTVWGLAGALIGLLQIVLLVVCIVIKIAAYPYSILVLRDASGSQLIPKVHV